MNVLYFLLIPLFSLIVYKRINYIIRDLREKKYSRLKVDIFLLALTILVIVLIVWVISTF